MHHVRRPCNVKITDFSTTPTGTKLKCLDTKKEKARLNSLKGNPPETFEMYHNRAFSNDAAINSCIIIFNHRLFASEDDELFCLFGEILNLSVLLHSSASYPSGFFGDKKPTHSFQAPHLPLYSSSGRPFQRIQIPRGIIAHNTARRLTARRASAPA